MLYIGSDILTNPNNVKLYVNSSSLTVEQYIWGSSKRSSRPKTQVVQHREPLADPAGGEATVGMQTFRNDSESQEEESQAKSSVVATGVGFVLGMILYMFLLIYGSMVMQSVIERRTAACWR